MKERKGKEGRCGEKEDKGGKRKRICNRMSEKKVLERRDEDKTRKIDKTREEE